MSAASAPGLAESGFMLSLPLPLHKPGPPLPTPKEAASREITARRSSKPWLREHLQEGIHFQSWLPGDILAAWRVSADPTAGTGDLTALAVRDAELDRQAEAICDAELHRLTSTSLSSPLPSSMRSTPRTAREQPFLLLLSNWMRRTQWETLFAQADRRFLIALYQTPAADGPYYLSTYGCVQLESSVQDEARLQTIMHALDRLFDRCADTVAHTDTAIRRWLRGRFIDRPYKAPFQLVVHERSERQYRRLLKRCLCMWLRLWRMPRASAKAVTRRSIIFEQDQALQKLWEDPVWSGTVEFTGDVRRTRGLHGTRMDPGTVSDLCVNEAINFSPGAGVGEHDDMIYGLLSGSAPSLSTTPIAIAAVKKTLTSKTTVQMTATITRRRLRRPPPAWSQAAQAQ